MNAEITHAKTDPATASVSSWLSSSSRTPRSTVADWRYSCMYGVIVVPIVAISRITYVEEVWSVGLMTDLPTSAQSGWARIAAIGYAKKGIVNQMKIRSAVL